MEQNNKQALKKLTYGAFSLMSILLSSSLLASSAAINEEENYTDSKRRQKVLVAIENNRKRRHEGGTEQPQEDLTTSLIENAKKLREKKEREYLETKEKQQSLIKQLCGLLGTLGSRSN
ncbi:MAG: hypothetical protein IBJ00_03245 [Alphaproteobacteria bacterium]|nr:hypothetical protein [Alphaproteobacteria bacterium]